MQQMQKAKKKKKIITITITINNNNIIIYNILVILPINMFFRKIETGVRNAEICAEV